MCSLLSGDRLSRPTNKISSSDCWCLGPVPNYNGGSSSRFASEGSSRSRGSPGWVLFVACSRLARALLSSDLASSAELGAPGDSSGARCADSVPARRPPLLPPGALDLQLAETGASPRAPAGRPLRPPPVLAGLAGKTVGELAARERARNRPRLQNEKRKLDQHLPALWLDQNARAHSHNGLKRDNLAVCFGQTAIGEGISRASNGRQRLI